MRRLAAETPASFVAFDLLALGDDVLLDRPLAERRAELLRVVRPEPPVHLTPASTDPATAAEWFGRFEGAGLDGVVAKRLDEPYQPDKRALVKVKHERTAECVVAGYRIHKDGNGVGSLLLGLYDDKDQLQHVGVAAAFSVKFRAELLAELEPLTHDAVDDHPWRDWAEWQHSDEARKPGATSRWNAGKDLSWVPIRGRAGGRGDVRPAREAALPPRRLVRPLAPRPHAGELPLRPARGRRPGAASRTSSPRPDADPIRASAHRVVERASALRLGRAALGCDQPASSSTRCRSSSGGDGRRARGRPMSASAPSPSALRTMKLGAGARQRCRSGSSR